MTEASASTIARWLAEDALKPWQHRSWIFPTDPAFLEKAGAVLDLYQGRWQGELLHPGEFVICADEKPSIQARARIHETLAPSPRSRGQRVEHTYERRGALTYLAALGIGRRDNDARGSSAAPRHGVGSQLEICLSIVQGTLLEPNDFANVPTSPARSTPSSATGTRSPSPSTGTSPATTSPR